ncbi:cell division protein PerM [Microbacterium sp. JZ101]
MHRILIALLAAFDALVAALVGLAVVLAPLTLLWTFTFGLTADWAGLWPTTARIWQLGNLVPLSLGFDEDAVVALGLPDEASSFTLTLAPLAFAVFAAFFAARSGRRAVRSGAGAVGVLAGIAMTAIIAAVVLATSGSELARVEAWQAVLLPTAVYAVGAAAGAWAEGWSEGDGGLADLVHERVDGWSSKWREVPTLGVRGGAVALAAVVGAAALAVVVAVLVRADAVVALFEQAQVDALGATALALAQVAYLPTLIGWAVSWIAGPGFAVGAATTVSPAGTQLGVVPGIPMLGLLPEQGSGWLLLVALLPVAAGALAGWHVRSALAAEWEIERPEGEDHPSPHEPVSPRVVLAIAIAAIAGAGAAGIAALSSGSIGPGRLATVGPDPGPVALAVGLEVLVGAAILLLSPRPHGHAAGTADGAAVLADGDELARR